MDPLSADCRWDCGGCVDEIEAVVGDLSKVATNMRKD